MVKLSPKNKHAWIQVIDEANRIGSLYTPVSVHNQYRLARIMALDEECAEGQAFHVGQTVLCDMVGVTDHRIGTQTVQTCLIRNFLGVVEEVPSEIDTMAKLAASVFNGRA